MNEKKIRIVIDADAPDERAGIMLEDALAASVHTPILLLLSGGSAFSLLEHVAPEVLGGHITIAVLDERYSSDKAVNNFAQLSATSFYESAQEAGCLFINTRVNEGESQRELAERFENAVREWRSENPEGVIITTLGMGADGHIAGIMPYPKDALLYNALFSSQEKWVVGYDAEDRNEHPLRITVTNTFLKNEVSFALWFVIGGEKSVALANTLATKEALYEVPARIVHEMREVVLVTDCEVE